MNPALKAEALRFLIVGGLNTAITYALYLALLPLLDYTVAYTVTYVLGIGLAYLLNTRFVFRVRPSVHSAVAFPFVYLIQYGVGMLVLSIAVRLLEIPQQYAMVAVIAVTVPLTFFLSRLSLTQAGPR